MFTGIIEEKGVVREVSKRIYILCKRVLEDLKIGDSIAVAGCCLTVSSLKKDGFISDLSQETLKTTNLSFLKSGALVNLERPLRLSDRLGGHIITGHINGLARLCEKRDDVYFFSLPKALSRYFLQNKKYEVLSLPEQEKEVPVLSKYLIKKGSIAIDGVSLTIVDIIGDRFSVSIIPQTLKETTFKEMNIGWKANIEVDYLTKIIEGLFTKSKLIFRTHQFGVFMANGETQN